MEKSVKLFLVIFLAIMCSAFTIGILSCINSNINKYEAQKAWLEDMAGRGP